MTSSSFFQSLDDLRGLTHHQIRKTFGGKALGLFEAKELGIAIPTTWLISSVIFSILLLGNVRNIPFGAN